MLTTILLLLLTLYILAPIKTPISKLPGPFYTILTSLPLIYHHFNGTRRLYIHSLHEKYGPVVRIGRNEVSVISTEGLEIIYKRKGGFDKTRFYELFRQLGVRTLFSTLGRKEHTERKRLLAPPYSNSKIQKPEIINGIQDRVDAFIQKCIDGKEKGADIYVLLHCYALDCATHFIFGAGGTKSLEGGEGFEIIREQSFHDSLKSNLLYHHFPYLTPILNSIITPRPSPLTTSYVFSNITKSKNAPSTQETLINTLFHHTKPDGEGEKEKLTNETIPAECLDHLAAGLDTTGDFLCFLLYHLSSPPNFHIQEKLRMEIREGRGGEYLDAVVKEGLRLWPPIPMSQPRLVPTEGTVIKGFYIPKGTIVSAQAWSVHRLAACFIDADADTFKPERWIVCDIERLEEMENSFFAWGLGGRGCTGKFLATAEIKLLLKGIYNRFTSKLKEELDKEKVGKEMEMEDQIISSRPRGKRCWVVFKEDEEGDDDEV